MKQMIALALAASLAGGCTPPTPPVAAPAAPAACAVTVTFASYAMGIDRGAFDAVQALLARDKGVTRNEARRWGREGEVTLCVDTRSSADATRLFEAIKPLFPVKPRGPLTVETASGARFETGATP
ncbi:MAG: hypothetical protein EOP59_20270 [Sphingomonadales bacterium]|nr:MAG: hypothetical protein EOP59_20270 [Sphingomonadales bacterium]